MFLSEMRGSLQMYFLPSLSFSMNKILQFQTWFFKYSFIVYVCSVILEHKLLMETVDSRYTGITQFIEIEVYGKIICKINSNIIKGKFSKIECLDQFTDNIVELTLGKLL